MAQLKGKENGSNLLAKLREKSELFNKTHPIVKTNWGVEEYFESVLISDEYDDHFSPSKRVLASPWFETEDEALDWLRKHDPDKGAVLRIVMRYLRKVPATTQWYPY